MLGRSQGTRPADSVIPVPHKHDSVFGGDPASLAQLCTLHEAFSCAIWCNVLSLPIPFVGGGGGGGGGKEHK